VYSCLGYVDSILFVILSEVNNSKSNREAGRLSGKVTLRRRLQQISFHNESSSTFFKHVVNNNGKNVKEDTKGGILIEVMEHPKREYNTTISVVHKSNEDD